MITPYSFNIFLAAMALMAVAVFIALHFVNAGYGMMYTRRWGPVVDNRLGWMLMEAPVFIAMALMWWFSPRRLEAAPLVMFLFFQAHYLQRSFIFPFLFPSRGKMPVSIILMAFTFNILNAIMQGGWIFYIAPRGTYPDTWLLSPQFITGAIIFIVGMGINLQSDSIIRHLRKPGDTRHYIPRGGMFRYVSSANYLGELIEWTGFAIMTWSWAGAVFALWTFANLAPRARQIRHRYASEFGEQFTRLNLKSIIPFIY